MRAITVNEYGPPETFVIQEHPDSPLKPDDVRIEVRGAGISFIDLLLAQGKYQVQPPLPYIPGTEFAGVVEQAGEASALRAGDRVLSGAMGGGYGETCVVPSAAVRKMPHGMSFDHGAVFRVSYGTAYYALVQRAGLKPDETVLVLGAAGAVGTACVQVAKALGATVIASASTEAKRALARECGADHVIETGAADWRDQIKALTDGGGVDVVFDPVGGDLTELAFRSLAWKGRHLVIGYAQGTIPSLPVNLALLKGASLVGVDVRQFGLYEADLYDRNMDALFHLYTDGKINPPIAATYPLDDFRTAMRAVMDGTAVGRVVLTP
ncbi:MAG: NADPH:quinone oxidoreductase family protein [Alphaproteobacteria bacterium]